MPQLIEKRRSLNKEINLQLQQNKELEARLAKLQALANLGTISAKFSKVCLPSSTAKQLKNANAD